MCVLKLKVKTNEFRLVHFKTHSLLQYYCFGGGASTAAAAAIAVTANSYVYLIKYDRKCILVRMMHRRTHTIECILVRGLSTLISWCCFYSNRSIHFYISYDCCLNFYNKIPKRSWKWTYLCFFIYLFLYFFYLQETIVSLASRTQIVTWIIRFTLKRFRRWENEREWGGIFHCDASSRKFFQLSTKRNANYFRSRFP